MQLYSLLCAQVHIFCLELEHLQSYVMFAPARECNEMVSDILVLQLAWLESGLMLVNNNMLLASQFLGGSVDVQKEGAIAASACNALLSVGLVCWKELKKLYVGKVL